MPSQRSIEAAACVLGHQIIAYFDDPTDGNANAADNAAGRLPTPLTQDLIDLIRDTALDAGITNEEIDNTLAEMAILSGIDSDLALVANQVIPTPTIPTAGLIDDYDIASISETHFAGDDVTSWISQIGTDVLNVFNPGAAVNPTYEAAAFNGLGGVRIDQARIPNPADIIVLKSTNLLFGAASPFADKTGTFAVVFEARVAKTGLFDGGFLTFGGNVRFRVQTASAPNRPFVQSLDQISGLETPALDLLLNIPQLFIWYRNGARIEFRHNGVQQVGVTLVTDPVPIGITTPTLLEWFGVTNKINSFDGVVARILRWDRVLTAQELSDVETELMELYL